MRPRFTLTSRSRTWHASAGNYSHQSSRPSLSTITPRKPYAVFAPSKKSRQHNSRDMDEPAVSMPLSSSPALTTTCANASHMGSTTLAASSASFLSLPPEIRNAIFKWLYPSGRSALQLLTRHRGGYIVMTDRLGLLTTCRQVYTDVSSLLRCQQRFEVVQATTVCEAMYMTDNTWRASLMNYIAPDGMITAHFNLDHHVHSVNIASMFHASSGFRQFGRTYGRGTIIVSASIVDDFEPLERWVQSQLKDFSSAFDRWRWRTHLELSFQSQDEGENESEDTFFQAEHFIQATEDLYADTTLSPGPLGVLNDENMTLRFFRLRLLCFIDHLLTEHAHQLDLFPRIWVNSDYEVVRADFEAEARVVVSIPNEHASIAQEDLFFGECKNDLLWRYAGYEGFVAGCTGFRSSRGFGRVGFVSPLAKLARTIAILIRRDD